MLFSKSACVSDCMNLHKNVMSHLLKMSQALVQNSSRFDANNCFFEHFCKILSIWDAVSNVEKKYHILKKITLS